MSSRFSLYCLSDGDEYFGDVIADYSIAGVTRASVDTSRGSPLRSSVPGAFSAALGGALGLPMQAASTSPLGRLSGAMSSVLGGRVCVRGHVRLAGRALFFEPDDRRLPIVALRYRDVLQRLPRDAPAVSASGDSFVVPCGTAVMQCTDGRWHPHRVDPTLGPAAQHHFRLTYAESSRKFVAQLNLLLALEAQAPATTAERHAALLTLKVAREAAQPFSLTFLRSPLETIRAQCVATRIGPLTRERGRVVVSGSELYFQSTFALGAPAERLLSLPDLTLVATRRVQFRDTAVEFAAGEGRTRTQCLLAFGTEGERSRVLEAIAVATCGGSVPRLLGGGGRSVAGQVSMMMVRWVQGSLSTLDYLMFLNWAAGRTVSDLSQYPVLPWVLQDYTSPALDLSDPASYRDLAKPMGALTEPRLRSFKQRAQELRDIGADEVYLYGSHYSNAAYVVYYLARAHPEYMLVLQSGRFDHGARIFDSIPAVWASATVGPTDLKELTPEFYFGDGHFLKENVAVDFGAKSDAERVRPAVELPPWAATPEEFVSMMRDALEGEHVARRVHQWIDLVFGYKQRGEAAWEADNVFHPLSYDDADADIADPVEREAHQVHVREFGQVPAQLFPGPHPPRECGATPPEAISKTQLLPTDVLRAPETEQLSPRGPSAPEASQDSARVGRKDSAAALPCGPPSDDEDGPAEELPDQLVGALTAPDDFALTPVMLGKISAARAVGGGPFVAAALVEVPRDVPWLDTKALPASAALSTDAVPTVVVVGASSVAFVSAMSPPAVLHTFPVPRLREGFAGPAATTRSDAVALLCPEGPPSVVDAFGAVRDLRQPQGLSHRIRVGAAGAWVPDDGSPAVALVAGGDGLLTALSIPGDAGRGVSTLVAQWDCEAWVTAAAVNAKGSCAVFANEDGTVFVVGAPEGPRGSALSEDAPVLTDTLQDPAPEDIVWAGFVDTCTVCLVSADACVHLFSTAGGALVPTAAHAVAAASDVAAACLLWRSGLPVLCLVTVGGIMHTVCATDAGPVADPMPIPGLNGAVRRLACDPNGRHVAMADEHGLCHVVHL